MARSKRLDKYGEAYHIYSKLRSRGFPRKEVRQIAACLMAMGKTAD
jgi:hypothetical protein